MRSSSRFTHSLHPCAGGQEWRGDAPGAACAAPAERHRRQSVCVQAEAEHRLPAGWRWDRWALAASAALLSTRCARAIGPQSSCVCHALQTGGGGQGPRPAMLPPGRKQGKPSLTLSPALRLPSALSLDQARRITQQRQPTPPGCGRAHAQPHRSGRCDPEASQPIPRRAPHPLLVHQPSLQQRQRGGTGRGWRVPL